MQYSSIIIIMYEEINNCLVDYEENSTYIASEILCTAHFFPCNLNIIHLTLELSHTKQFKHRYLIINNSNKNINSGMSVSYSVEKIKKSPACLLKQKIAGNYAL